MKGKKTELDKCVQSVWDKVMSFGWTVKSFHQSNSMTLAWGLQSAVSCGKNNDERWVDKKTKQIYSEVKTAQWCL